MGENQNQNNDVQWVPVDPDAGINVDINAGMNPHVEAQAPMSEAQTPVDPMMTIPLQPEVVQTVEKQNFFKTKKGKFLVTLITLVIVGGIAFYFGGANLFKGDFGQEVGSLTEGTDNVKPNAPTITSPTPNATFGTADLQSGLKITWIDGKDSDNRPSTVRNYHWKLLTDADATVKWGRDWSSWLSGSSGDQDCEPLTQDNGEFNQPGTWTCPEVTIPKEVFEAGKSYNFQLWAGDGALESDPASVNFSVAAPNVAPEAPTPKAPTDNQEFTLGAPVKLEWDAGKDDFTVNKLMGTMVQNYKWVIKGPDGQPVWDRGFHESAMSGLQDSEKICNVTLSSAENNDWICKLVTIPAEKITKEGTYTWQVWAGDGQFASPASKEMHFKVTAVAASSTTNTAPEKPKVKYPLEGTTVKLPFVIAWQDSGDTTGGTNKKDGKDVRNYQWKISKTDDKGEKKIVWARTWKENGLMGDTQDYASCEPVDGDTNKNTWTCPYASVTDKILQPGKYSLAVEAGDGEKGSGFSDEVTFTVVAECPAGTEVPKVKGLVNLSSTCESVKTDGDSKVPEVCPDGKYLAAAATSCTDIPKFETTANNTKDAEVCGAYKKIAFGAANPRINEATKKTITDALASDKCKFPAVPSNITAKAMLDGIEVTFDKVDDATSYILYRKEGEAATKPVDMAKDAEGWSIAALITGDKIPATGTQVKVIDDKADKYKTVKYSYMVVAGGAVHSSDFSAIAVTNPDDAKIPSNIVITATGGDKQVQLTWTDSTAAGKVETYKIFRDLLAGVDTTKTAPVDATTEPGNLVASQKAADGLTYIDKIALQNDKDYFYVIEAFDKDGKKIATAAEVKTHTNVSHTVVLSLDTIGDKQVKLKWTVTGDVTNIDHFELYRASPAAPSATASNVDITKKNMVDAAADKGNLVSNTITADTKDFTDTKALENSKDYYYALVLVRKNTTDLITSNEIKATPAAASTTATAADCDSGNQLLNALYGVYQSQKNDVNSNNYNAKYKELQAKGCFIALQYPTSVSPEVTQPIGTSPFMGNAGAANLFGDNLFGNTTGTDVPSNNQTVDFGNGSSQSGAANGNTTQETSGKTITKIVYRDAPAGDTDTTGSSLEPLQSSAAAPKTTVRHPVAGYTPHRSAETGPEMWIYGISLAGSAFTSRKYLKSSKGPRKAGK